MSRFEGSDSYVAPPELALAVNAAVTLGRPLLVKGEPGTGKTQLAQEVARALDAPLFEWHIKSNSKSQHGLYEYDAVSRLRDSQLGDGRVKDIANYIVPGMLWHAFESEQRAVLLIDEIDKADIEFPNDLLRELDRMEFYVYETQQLVRARQRPVVFITSNNEKELPDAFLRRCFFHYIRFPDAETMERIVAVHHPGLKKALLAEALAAFYRIREMPGLRKKPTTSELLDWIKLLVAEDIPPEALRANDAKAAIPPLYGALLKNEQDVHLFEQLVFLEPARGQARLRRAWRHADPLLPDAARRRRTGDADRVPGAARGAVDRGLSPLPVLMQRGLSPLKASRRSSSSTSWPAPCWSRTSAISTASTAYSPCTSTAPRPPSRPCWQPKYRRTGCAGASRWA